MQLEPINEELHGDYVNDKTFKRCFQRWLNTLWDKKDIQIEEIATSYKTPVSDRRSLFFINQIFHGISILLNKNIHAAGIHACGLIWYLPLTNTAGTPCSYQVSRGFLLLRNQ